jgi:hypothetical protein
LSTGKRQATILLASFVTTSLTRTFQKLPFVSKTPSGIQLRRCENILLWARTIVRQKIDLQNLRSWPVAGFEAIRIYYLAAEDAIHVIRILHGKRDVKYTLEGENAI